MPKYTLYRDYIRISLRLLDICPDICMLEGWKDSKGARLEYAYAEALGKRIIYQTPPTEETDEKKYYWKLKGEFDGRGYLNFRKEIGSIMISDKKTGWGYNARLSELEFYAIVSSRSIPKDMFIKEEIE